MSSWSRVGLVCVIAVGSIVCRPSVLFGVVISSGDGSGNITAPSDEAAFSDFGFWESVGRQGSGAAVYLGNRWVLTAVHIDGVNGDPGSVTFGGQPYARDTETATIRLTNPGDGPDSDLRLFRLTEIPDGIPTATLSTAMPEVGDEVVMIGHGRDREAEQTYWNDMLVEVPPSQATAAGFKLLSSRSARWGTNRVAENNVLIELKDQPAETVISTMPGFSTVFNDGASATSFESQAVTNDSGGGVFVRGGGGDWELAGLIHAAVGLEGVEAAVFGGVTFISDLSSYHSQIMMHVIPEPSTLVLVAGPILVWGARRRS